MSLFGLCHSSHFLQNDTSQRLRALCASGQTPSLLGETLAFMAFGRNTVRSTGRRIGFESQTLLPCKRSLLGLFRLADLIDVEPSKLGHDSENQNATDR